MKGFKKAILTGTALLGSLFAAQKANAQGFETDYNKKQQEKRVNLTDDDQTVTRKLDDVLRGSLRFGAETSPLVDTFSGSAYAEFMAGDLRPYFGVQDVFQKYDNLDGSKLEVNSIREVAALGWYLKNTPELEVYLRGVLGNENSKFSKAIDMDAHRIIYGGEFGLASQEKGISALLKAYKGTGTFDAELNSGYEIDGDYDTTFLGLDLVKRVHKSGRKNAAVEGEFDRRERGNEAERLTELVAELYWNRNEFGDLEHDDTYSIRAGPRFIWNFRDENGKGAMLSLLPYYAFKHVKTGSDISLRETQTNSHTIGVIPELQISRNVVLGGNIGVQYNGQKIDDPGQNLRENKSRTGVLAGLYVELRF